MRHISHKQQPLREHGFIAKPVGNTVGVLRLICWVSFSAFVVSGISTTIAVVSIG